MSDEIPGHDPDWTPDSKNAGLAALELLSHVIDTLRKRGILSEDELLSMAREARKDFLESEGDQKDRQGYIVNALLMAGVKS